MMISIFYSIIVLAIAIPHIWIMARRRLYRELVVFGLLMAPGSVFGFMAANLYLIEDPLFFLEWMYRPVNDLFSKFFPS